MSDGFLQRWSKLKQVQRESHDESHQPIMDEELEVNALAADEEGFDAEAPVNEEFDSAAESRPLTDEDMPDIDSIDAKSDMSAFFSTGVSAELKRQALKKYFHQHEFNFRDPLDEYNLDYSQPVKLTAAVGEKIRGWAEKQMEDAMQQARTALTDETIEKPVDADRSQKTHSVQEDDGPDFHEQSAQQETK